MYMRKIISLLVLIISLSVPGLLPGQVTITGPTCVATGTVYQYNIQGPWDSTSTMQVCITGGTIADSSITGHCTAASGAPLAAVRVSWDDLSGGSLSLTSSKGNASLQVNVTSALQPGMIDSTALIQEVDSGSIPQAIACSPAREGPALPGTIISGSSLPMPSAGPIYRAPRQRTSSSPPASPRAAFTAES